MFTVNLHCLCVTYKDCSGWIISIVDWSHRKLIHKVYSVCSIAGCSLIIAECIVTFKVHVYIIDSEADWKGVCSEVDGGDKLA